MNTKLIVKKTTAPDNTYFIQPKYAVVAMTIGSTAATTYCTLQTIRVGFDTSGNYDLWKSQKSYDPVSGTTTLIGRDTAGIVGNLGELSIETLSNLISYSAVDPSSDM
jgi:hypothetical protein